MDVFDEGCARFLSADSISWNSAALPDRWNDTLRGATCNYRHINSFSFSFFPSCETNELTKYHFWRNRRGKKMIFLLFCWLEKWVESIEEEAPLFRPNNRKISKWQLVTGNFNCCDLSHVASYQLGSNNIALKKSQPRCKLDANWMQMTCRGFRCFLLTTDAMLWNYQSERSSVGNTDFAHPFYANEMQIESGVWCVTSANKARINQGDASSVSNGGGNHLGGFMSNVCKWGGHCVRAVMSHLRSWPHIMQQAIRMSIWMVIELKLSHANIRSISMWYAESIWLSNPSPVWFYSAVMQVPTLCKTVI